MCHSLQRTQNPERSLISPIAETLSEGAKILKIDYLVKAIQEHKMDKAIIFCRTKLDCDNCERFLMTYGGGKTVRPECWLEKYYNNEIKIGEGR